MTAGGWLKRMAIPLLQRLDLYSSVLLRRQGPLLDDGWFRSFREQRPVDGDGNPIPWLTYPAIDFLKERVVPSLSVFEYGCGNSTLWWAARVRRVVAIEHDRDWVEEIRPRIPANALLHHVPLAPAAAYAETLLADSPPFDVVVIDGRHRNECLARAPQALSSGGVIILDNSERPQYKAGIGQLHARGFRQVDFSGLVPATCWKSRTSIFYRDGNCLGL